MRRPSRRPGRLFFVLFLLATCAGRLSAAPPEPPVDYNRDIRPILSDNCFACHGPDEKQRKAGLRLDIHEGASAEAAGRRPAVVAGQAGRERAALPDRDRRRDPAHAPGRVGQDPHARADRPAAAVGRPGAPWSHATGRSSPPKQAHDSRRLATPPGRATRSTGSCWPGSRPRA